MLYHSTRLSDAGGGRKKKDKTEALQALKQDPVYSAPKPTASEKLALGMGPISDQVYQQAIKQQVQAVSPQTAALRDSPATRATILGQALGRVGTPGTTSTKSAAIDAAKAGLQALATPSYSTSDTTFSGSRTQTQAPSTPAYTTQSQPSASAPTGQSVDTLREAVGPGLGATITPTGPVASSIDAIRQDMSDMIGRLETTGASQIQQLNSFYTGLLSQIENMRRDLVARSERDQQELDPATMHSLDLLRESAQENLRRVREEANRRGILDSGIALSMEQESDRAFQQAEAGILSDRLQRIRETLDAQLNRLQEMAFGVQRERGQAVFDAQRDLENRLMQARQYRDQRLDTELERGLRTREQMLREALATADITGRYISPDAQALVDQILQAKERNRTGQDPTAAAQADAARRRLEAMGYDTSGLGPDVPLDQAYRNAANIGIRMPQATSPGPAQPNLNTATRNALVIAQQYTNRDEALADLQAQLPNFLASGVDLEVLMDYINRLPSRGNPTMGEALRALRGH